MPNPTVLYSEAGVGGKPYTPGQWREIAVHNDKVVHGFFGPYRFLSNTWPAEVSLDGVIYPSVENAYKAWRWKPEDRSYFVTCSAIEAIKRNRELEPNGMSVDEWMMRRRTMMILLNFQKYDSNSEASRSLRAKLLETGDRYLEETNWWGDEYWGVYKKSKDDPGVGSNVLGHILMEIRAYLISKEGKSSTILKAT